MTSAAPSGARGVLPAAQFLLVLIACSQPLGQVTTTGPLISWTVDASCWTTSLPLFGIAVPNGLIAVYSALILLHRWTSSGRANEGLGFVGAMTGCGIVHASLLIVLDGRASSVLGPWLALIAFALPAVAMYVGAFLRESRASSGDAAPRQGSV